MHEIEAICLASDSVLSKNLADKIADLKGWEDQKKSDEHEYEVDKTVAGTTATYGTRVSTLTAFRF